ncbi:MAG TPA: patatin-like phospholipase family protein [Thermoanaerobaculia bacterium]|jgi:hypothetical protein|nr:patatin-like phospholipase family protein [Thermoanaerobaculia bacterium]
MSAIALELHDVLEEEYVRTGGEVLPSPDDPITKEDLLDPEALTKLFNLVPDRLVKYLEGLRNIVDPREPGPLTIVDAKEKLTPATRRLLEGYDGADEAWQLRINRRMLEEVLGDAIRGAKAWPEITADQIIDLNSCRGTLAAIGISCSYDSETRIAGHLETLHTCTDPEDTFCPAKCFAGSPRLTCNTTLLVGEYETFDEATRKVINRRVLDDVFEGSILRWRDVRLGRLYGELHKRRDDTARTAFCISGGGIRSATFALGVMQGLAGRGLLKRFDFLSTVSGGGYIGGWLTSWARRHPEGIAGVEKHLSALDTPSGTGRGGRVFAEAKLQPEAKPVRHLREYSNYLTPRLGITSGDTWTFAALYVRNLIINLLVLVPLLAFILAVPRWSALALSHIRDLPLLPFVIVADLSLLALYWYIGRARPVRHGSEAKDLPWPVRALSPAWRFAIFCFGAGSGASIAIAMTWAKWVALTTRPFHPSDIDYLTIEGGIVVALLAMTVIPCTAYFRRYIKAPYAARRESIAAGTDGGNRSIKNQRIIFESLAALIAATGAVGLYYFFAQKVFDRPLDSLDDFDVSPFLLAGKTLASNRLLFICFGAPVVLIVLFLQATVFVAGSGKFNEDYDREWWGRAGGWLLSGGVAWLVFSAISIFGPLAIYQFPTIVGALGGASGLVAILLGRSSTSAAAAKSEGAASKSDKALALAVPLFCIFVLAAISSLTTLIIQKVEKTEAPNRVVEAQLESVITSQPATPVRYEKLTISEARRTKPIAMASQGLLRSHAHLATVENASGAELLWIFVVAAVAFGASFAVGANRFSMHALYRNRLIRAYLGASRYDRDPDHLTGFDPYDNVEMYKLRPELLWTTSFRHIDEFIDDLRKGIAETPAKAMSTKIARLLQTGTREMLIDGATLDAVIEALDQATRERDQQIIDRAKTTLRNVESYLPRAAKRLAKLDKLDKVLDVAKKEVTKRKKRLDGENGRAVVIDTLVQDLNRVLIEGELTEGAMDPALRVIENRAAFDREYAEWIVARPPVKRGDPTTTDAARMEWRQPLHIVNAALNLVSGKNLAWQQRKAEPFTISPLHSGSAFVGYRDSRAYGGGLRGISLGTAVTISGAAASPNQGYHSSIPLAFLLTMFNVRLGWWLGNPGAAGKKTYTKDNPSSTVALLTREMLGETNDTYSWVYLSDGGHFENLGLYEMVLRRCRYIVVSDGGCDPKFTFEDLGNAIRKIRIDLGVPIEFNDMPMRTRDEDSPWNYVAVGSIRYEAVDGQRAKPGKLVYLKPGYYRDENLPKDVMNYAKEFRDFPHESTADQWFSESQFESYRTLGRHVIDHVAPTPEFATVASFVEEVDATAKKTQEPSYVPVVAQRITVKKGTESEAAVVLPSSAIRRQQT